MMEYPSCANIDEGLTSFIWSLVLVSQTKVLLSSTHSFKKPDHNGDH